MYEALPTCVIADDNAVIREVLALRLEDYGLVDVIGQATNCPTAVELISATCPDVAYVDIRMPGGTGIDVVRQVRALGLPTRIMMFSASHERSMVVAARTAGADGFMLKDAPAGVFVAALEGVLNGGPFVDAGSPDVIHALSRLGERCA